MKKSRQSQGRTVRLRFPEDEQRSPWLAVLLEAYAVADAGIAAAVRQTVKREGSPCACARGCDVCCRQSDIPLYPHELLGIYWYAAEKLAPPDRETVKTNLANHVPGQPCPFLVDGVCVLHPVRPLGCRQFTVFGRPCAPGEDPYYSRRHDVLPPLPAVQDRVFARVLSLYRLKEGIRPAEAVNLIRRQIMNLAEFDWKRLATIMEQVEKSRIRSPEVGAAAAAEEKGRHAVS